jgi:hypothetical protein
MMSDDLTFVAVEFRAEVIGGAYDVETVHDEWWAWFFPKGAGRTEEILDPLGKNWPTKAHAIEACRKHHALRTSSMSIAVAGPVSVDADGAPV